MRRIEALGLAFLAAFALGAVLAATAQGSAPRWTVTEGGVAKTLAAGEERASSPGETTGTATLGTAAVTFEVGNTCSINGTMKGSGAGQPGMLTGAGHCAGVKVKEAPACNVHSPGAEAGTVLSNVSKVTLVWLEKEGDKKVGLKFQADEGTVVGTIVVTGCALAGEYSVTGELLCEAGPETAITGHVVQGTVNCPATPILKYFTNQTPVRTEDTISRLKLGGANAFAIGHYINVHLTGEIPAGIEPG